jgi:GntR family transcriptional regulator, transcriptional repressor for pyruvate dehydrogenase complex
VVTQPRIGEIVADRLRREILDGTWADGESLPTQDELLRRFRVSRPSMREALRLLEAEGLISVRRGKVGGARVHPPRPENAAYTFGLVLQAQHVPLADLGRALLSVEPLCTELAARRQDRERAVVRILRDLNLDLRESLDDLDRFTSVARQFHEAVIDGCGSETLRLMVGTLVALWSAHEMAWAEHSVDAGRYPDVSERRATIRTHERLTDLIAAGEATKATTLLRRHLEATQAHVLGADGSPVRVTSTPLTERLGRL